MNFIFKEFEEKIKALGEFVSFKAFDTVGNEIHDSEVLSEKEKNSLLGKVWNKYINKCCHTLNYDVCPRNVNEVLTEMKSAM